MAKLVLGPALRYAGETEALIWVETDAPCTVSVLGCEAKTFCVEGHHFALVVCEGLEPGTITPYEVALDAETVWPLPDDDLPPSRRRSARPTSPARGEQEPAEWPEALILYQHLGNLSPSELDDLDLEHRAAFGESLERMLGIFKAVGTGERGEPPASIVALSGDVHHAYLAEVGFPAGTGMRSTAWQATCSPFRNPLDKKERRVMRFMASEPAALIMRALARATGVEDPSVRWRYAHDEPWFDNQVATLELDDRRTRFVLEKTVPPDHDAEDPALRLERVFERDLN